jgi:iron-sulfur cluster assembly protein/iron-sulfur cluster insertion protein
MNLVKNVLQLVHEVQSSVLLLYPQLFSRNEHDSCCGPFPGDNALTKLAICRMLTPVISLTDSAARRILELQRDSGAEGKLLRLFVSTGGCSGMEYGMSFDQMKDGDTRMESLGIAFLVDGTTLERIDGSSVHFDDGLHGKGFEVRNPRAVSTCGCGRSFN